LSIHPEDIHRFCDLSSPCVSPVGDAIVYVSTRTLEDRSVTESRLTILEGDSRPLTAGPKDGSPAYSPDGRFIAFLRPGDCGGKQVWMISTDSGEAFQVTHLESGVQAFAWAPGSDRLALVSRVDPESGGDEDGPKTQVVRRVRYRDDGEGWRGDAFSQLFVFDIESGDCEQLTKDEGDHLAPAWSPEGARIAFVCDAIEGRDFSRHSEVRVITLDGGHAVKWSKGMTRAGSVAWSHDGHQLVAAGSHDPDVWDPRQSWLYVLEPGHPARLVAGDDRAIVQPLPAGCWTRNDDLIYIADQAGESYLCSVHADGGEEEVILGGEQTMTSLHVRGDKAVVVSASTERPGDVCEVDLGAGSAELKTDTNIRVLAEYPPASVEKISFDRKGYEIQARLLFPQDFDDSKAYPLVLEIHGGPNGRFSDSYDTAQQILVGEGYLVLAVNPRGSSSYGPEFMKAVLRDWGGEDFLDLMAAVDLVSERGYVDTDRLGVHGYSYGGFMSSWIIGHDHRFKAAVIGAPVTNLYSFYGTSDIGVSFGENQFGGSTLENVEKLVERSPLTYASEVTTPALLLHGETDYRCPIEQSEQFYVALKRQKKAVEFVRFPDSGHGFRKAAHPMLRQEYYDRMVRWLSQYLK
jgi:dipeptidyl aminopeptidase/acylaminoacyl peptidase